MPRRVVASDTGRTHGRATLGVITILTLLTTVACTVGPSTRPALVVAGPAPAATTAGGDSGSSALPPLETPHADTIEWADCDDQTRRRLGDPAPPAGPRFRCGLVHTPLDASRGQHDVTRIALLKVGTGATPLVVINDVDGLPGTLYAARLAERLPAAVLRTFSLIGMDRRGTGDSDGVRCVPQSDRDQIVNDDPASTDVNALLDLTRDASQRCVLDLETRIDALDTHHTVDDLEQVRRRLGIVRLDAIGHGEGSRVLTGYADRYPNHVGRLVLDGSPDPTLGGIDAALARATAAEAALWSFARDCVSHRCPMGADPRGAVTGLVERSRVQPIPVPGGAPLHSGAVLRAILWGLASPVDWPVLATAITQAIAGDGTGLATLLRPMISGSPDDPPTLDATLASGCDDDPDRLSPAQVSEAVRDWQARLPVFGALFAQNMLLCGPWPVPRQPLPRPTASAAPPILVLSTATDPVTPEAGTVRTAQSLLSGVLVSWQGTGHGALGWSECATTATTRFLVDGYVPRDGTACPP